MGGVSSLLLHLNSASCLPVLRLALLFLAFYAAMRLARPEAPPRRTRRRPRQALKASGCSEEQLEEACQSPGTCCHVPLETLTLAHGLRLVEERIQDVARHLEEVLIPPSVSTLAGSSLSSSSWDSSSSVPCGSSCIALREASQRWSLSLCRAGETVSVVGWEGPSRPTPPPPLPRPRVPSRRDRPEQPAGRAQPSAPAFDSSLRHEHLASQPGALTLSTESLAQVAPSRPAGPPPEGHPAVMFVPSRVPRPGRAAWEEPDRPAWEELDRPARTGRTQQEQDFPAPRKPPRPLLPPAPQPPTPGQPVLGGRDTEQPWDLLPAPPTRGFPAQLPPPPRADSRPRRGQGSQEPCVCPTGPPPPKAPRAVPAPDPSPARRVSTVAAKLQGHVAQKCLEIQRKAFPRLVGESHRSAAFPGEPILAWPPQPPGEPGEGGAAASPARGRAPAPPLSPPGRRMQLATRWGLPPPAPEPPAKPPPPVPARRAGPEPGEMETDLLLATQERGRPDAPWKARGGSRAPGPPPCAWRPRVEVVLRRGELRFLRRDTRKRLELHLVKLQVQQRWGLPRRVQDSRGEFTAPVPGQSGRLSPPHGGGVAPDLSPPSWKAQSGHRPAGAPAERGMEAPALPADTRRQLARLYSRKYPGAARGGEPPAHRPAWQTQGQSAGSSGSRRPPTPGTGGSDGAAGGRASPEPCDLRAGAAPTSPPPGPDGTEQTLTATLHVPRSAAGVASKTLTSQNLLLWVH
ncbi:uncharacterized protein LOC112544881 [Pelodiscus sinensis]|uniref:uncharacterized protein LOC112544881 n=1 Tax=Pelodiscus sinensis TaxID=13735 RepID=UPI003F6B0A0E